MVWVWKFCFWETRSPGEVSCLPDWSDITDCPLCASSLKPEWLCPRVSASDLGQPQPTSPPCGTWGVCLHLDSRSCCRTGSTCFPWSLPVSSAPWSYHLRGLGPAACLCPLRKDNASSCRNGTGLQESHLQNNGFLGRSLVSGSIQGTCDTWSTAVGGLSLVHGGEQVESGKLLIPTSTWAPQSWF